MDPLMSQEDVEIAKRCVELFGQGEMEAALLYVDPTIETIEGAELPGAPTYFGHAGLTAAYDHWAGQWDDFRMQLKELLDAGGDLFAVTRHLGVGRASGAAVEALVADVFTADDGKLVRIRSLHTKAQAPRSREAAGVAAGAVVSAAATWPPLIRPMK
jgi:ketosteroid isomerase-like protein